MITIKIFGAGCPKCKQTERVVSESVSELSLEAEIIKVTDLNDIMEAGVMMTPAVMINDEIKFSGKVPRFEECVKILEEYK